MTSSDPEALLTLLTTTRAELEVKPDVTVAQNVSYEAIKGVDRLHSDLFSPAYFYFAGDELKMVYVPHTAFEPGVASAWLKRFGPGPQLRSRAGRRAVLEVRPEVGVAFSHEDGELQLVEIFDSTTLDAYERDIYEDPGDFIR
jgi:hypothetical protein